MEIDNPVLATKFDPTQINNVGANSMGAQTNVTDTKISPSSKFSEYYPEHAGSRSTVWTQKALGGAKTRWSEAGGLVFPLTWNRTVEDLHFLDELFADAAMHGRENPPSRVLILLCRAISRAAFAADAGKVSDYVSICRTMCAKENGLIRHSKYSCCDTGDGGRESPAFGANDNLGLCNGSS
jgi:hypothetical protein